jgi:hypothetical protein
VWRLGLHEVEGRGGAVARKNDRTSDVASPWAAFASRHRGHPLLQKNPLYALPKGLIDRIEALIPGLWTPDEEGFERDLAETATGGFFHRKPFPCPFLPAPASAAADRACQATLEMEAEGLRAAGLHDVQVQRYLEKERQLQEAATLRALAYTGWLIANRQFLAERDVFRNVWEERVKETGCFPAHRLSFLGEQGEPVGQEEAVVLTFYRRWGLHTFLTWEVPVPMQPHFYSVVYQDTVTLGGAGLHLFLPWHLLRDQQLTLRQLASQLRTARHPEHLRGWFSSTAEGRKGLGYKRLKNAFVLHWCRKLALAERYGDRLAGHTERLDLALSEFLGLTVDSVKKVRLAEGPPPEE